ncbi:hypothetical protein RJ639_018442 [Escallonia herrerae]|uniref:Uncharacterized protein n=1 Tax=Escallonia herrerae TaxID=1293975 RepID=A0AA88V708_9ASTE|nr:hypothetical protein RJ639_018442 [Escallonia herrerae]
MANAEEAVDFEPEDDDLMDEDGGGDGDASPRAPIPKLKSAITGGAPSGPPKRTKGRGFLEETVANRMSGRFDSLDSEGGPGPERWLEGSSGVLNKKPKDLMGVFVEMQNCDRCKAVVHC